MQEALCPKEPVLNMVGQKVALGPLRRDLVSLYVRWFNDFDVTRTLMIGWQPMTLETEEVWYERASKGDSDKTFTIYERTTMRPIGNAGLNGVNHSERSAEFGTVIGEKECWGRGYGTEVACLMLDYGFNGLGLHNIMLRAVGYNERGIRAYKRAGFRLIGRRREAHRLGGRAYDIVYMDCPASEFKSPLLHKLLPSE